MTGTWEFAAPIALPGKTSTYWPIKVAFAISTGPVREGSRADSDVHHLRGRGGFRGLGIGPIPLCVGEEGAARKP
jgi:hypothetical protein